MQTREPLGSPSVGGRYLLWDLDNCNAPPKHLPAFLQRLRAAAGDVDQVIVAGTQAVLAVHADFLARAGVRVLVAPSGPDGAERALLAAVADVRAPAVMVVASDDHAFAVLALAGHRVEVLTRRADLVAADLLRVAASVTQIDPTWPPIASRDLDRLRRRRAEAEQRRADGDPSRPGESA